MKEGRYLLDSDSAFAYSAGRFESHIGLAEQEQKMRRASQSMKEHGKRLRLKPSQVSGYQAQGLQESDRQYFNQQPSQSGHLDKAMAKSRALADSKARQLHVLQKAYAAGVPNELKKAKGSRVKTVRRSSAKLAGPLVLVDPQLAHGYESQ